MIEKNEILETATRLGIPISTIEKDYVLGWLLAAIQHHKDLSDTWVFKGGTCLKKCYFDKYRFSEDLDFTLIESSHLNESFLNQTLTEITNWVYNETGIEMPKKGITR